jgi:alpha-ribazole phosphatase
LAGRLSSPVLFVARHAPVAAPGVCYGQSDVPTQVDPAEAAAILLGQVARGGLRIDLVWTSPWQRTHAPATAIAERLGVPVVVDARISELSFGTWEGQAFSLLESDARFVSWMSDWQHEAPPGGERLSDLVDRVRSWRSDVRARGDVALALTHAGVIRALRADERGAPYASVVSEPVTPLVIERIG